MTQVTSSQWGNTVFPSPCMTWGAADCDSLARTSLHVSIPLCHNEPVQMMKTRECLAPPPPPTQKSRVTNDFNERLIKPPGRRPVLERPGGSTWMLTNGRQVNALAGARYAPSCGVHACAPSSAQTICCDVAKLQSHMCRADNHTAAETGAHTIWKTRHRLAHGTIHLNEWAEH